MVVLVRPGLLPLELGLVHQTFGHAQSVSGDHLYEVITCAPCPGSVTTDADFTISVEHGLEALESAQTVIVPASHSLDEAVGPGAEDPSVQAIRSLPSSTRVASICTGAFVLAAAGLLDGKRATTHWKSTDLFRRSFPGVDVDQEVLYVDEGRVLTSAGEASGLDLCLHMIRSDHGTRIANNVARSTVVAPHRDGGQSQFIRRPVAEPRSASTSAARKWALDHLDRQILLSDLAARESMSVRTFSRRFRDDVGLSPLVWLAHQRLLRARELLEETDLPVESIALRTGFGTGASLRQHLRATMGVSPSHYRRNFRGVDTG